MPKCMQLQKLHHENLIPCSLPGLVPLPSCSGQFLPPCRHAAAADRPREHQEFEATLDAPYRGDGERCAPRRARSRCPSIIPGLQRTPPRDVAPGAGGAVRPPRRALAGPGDCLPAPASTCRCAGGTRGRAAAPRPASTACACVRRAAAKTVDQAWDIAVGTLPAPRAAGVRAAARPPRPAAAAPAPGALPYTVYYGNLHSQTSHSDGGGRARHLPRRAGSADRALRPGRRLSRTRARHGLDILMVSEHNHMYDGSDGTNAGRRSGRRQGAVPGRPADGARHSTRASGLPGAVRHGVGRDQQRRPPEHLQQRRAAGLGNATARASCWRTPHTPKQRLRARCTR